MKLGIIRCYQTRDSCPGTTDFKFIREKKGAFEDVEGNIELVGFNDCGGCPGKRAVFRAREMVKRGADTIAFTSCISKGTLACPYAEKMHDAVREDLDQSIIILDYTH